MAAIKKGETRKVGALGVDVTSKAFVTKLNRLVIRISSPRDADTKTACLLVESG